MVAVSHMLLKSNGWFVQQLGRASSELNNPGSLVDSVTVRPACPVQEQVYRLEARPPVSPVQRQRSGGCARAVWQQSLDVHAQQHIFPKANPCQSVNLHCHCHVVEQMHPAMWGFSWLCCPSRTFAISCEGLVPLLVGETSSNFSL